VIIRAMVPTDARPNTFGLRINFVPMEETDTDAEYGVKPIMRGRTKRQVAPQRDNTRLPRIHGPIQLFELLLARSLAIFSH